jgi:hypothetical protein
MRKSRAVSLSITAAMALALTGCGSDEPSKDSYQAVCVDQKTNQRISDNQCDSGGGSGGLDNGFLWYYLAMNRGYPPVGGYVRDGSYAAPSSGNYVRGGASTTGGTVNRDSLVKASSAKGASTYRSGAKSSSFSSGSKGSSGSTSRGGFGGGAKGASGG